MDITANDQLADLGIDKGAEVTVTSSFAGILTTLQPPGGQLIGPGNQLKLLGAFEATLS